MKSSTTLNSIRSKVKSVYKNESNGEDDIEVNSTEFEVEEGIRIRKSDNYNNNDDHITSNSTQDLLNELRRSLPNELEDELNYLDQKRQEEMDQSLINNLSNSTSTKIIQKKQQTPIQINKSKTHKPPLTPPSPSPTPILPDADSHSLQLQSNRPPLPSRNSSQDSSNSNLTYATLPSQPLPIISSAAPVPNTASNRKFARLVRGNNVEELAVQKEEGAPLESEENEQDINEEEYDKENLNQSQPLRPQVIPERIQSNSQYNRRINTNSSPSVASTSNSMIDIDPQSLLESLLRADSLIKSTSGSRTRDKPRKRELVEKVEDEPDQEEKVEVDVEEKELEEEEEEEGEDLPTLDQVFSKSKPNSKGSPKSKFNSASKKPIQVFNTTDEEEDEEILKAKSPEPTRRLSARKRKASTVSILPSSSDTEDDSIIIAINRSNGKSKDTKGKKKQKLEKVVDFDTEDLMDELPKRRSSTTYKAKGKGTKVESSIDNNDDGIESVNEEEDKSGEESSNSMDE